MGNTFDCNCFNEGLEGLASLQEESHISQIMNKLQTGATFTRPMMLGLASQEVFVRLSDDTAHLAWRTTKAWTGEEKGQVDLTDESVTIKSTGTQGIQFVGIENKVLLEINAESQATRDDWIVSLNELRMKWKKDNRKPISSVSAEGHSNKSEYYARRQEEIEARRRESEQRKSKYSAGGMRVTAEIMASRGS